MNSIFLFTVSLPLKFFFLISLILNQYFPASEKVICRFLLWEIPLWSHILMYYPFQSAYCFLEGVLGKITLEPVCCRGNINHILEDGPAFREWMAQHPSSMPYPGPLDFTINLELLCLLDFCIYRWYIFPLRPMIRLQMGGGGLKIFHEPQNFRCLQGPFKYFIKTEKCSEN